LNEWDGGDKRNNQERKKGPKETDDLRKDDNLSQFTVDKRRNGRKLGKKEDRRQKEGEEKKSRKREKHHSVSDTRYPHQKHLNVRSHRRHIE